jgi:hypothetical protein
MDSQFFMPSLVGADGVFRAIAVEAGLAALQVGGRGVPLVEQVLVGQPEPRFGHHSLTQAFGGAAQRSEPQRPLGLAQCRALACIAYPGFVPTALVGLKAADQFQHEVGLRGRFFSGFRKLSSCVRPARHPGDAFGLAGVGGVVAFWQDALARVWAGLKNCLYSRRPWFLPERAPLAFGADQDSSHRSSPRDLLNQAVSNRAGRRDCARLKLYGGRRRAETARCPVARSSVVMRERVLERKSAVGRRLVDVPGDAFRIFVTNRPKSATIIWRDHTECACERVFYAP